MKKTTKIKILAATLALGLTTGLAAAAEGNAPTSTGKKMGGMSGTSVSTPISGGGIVPKGKLLTVFNSSYRNKYNVIDGGESDARTLVNEIYLLKIRYSPLDRLELILVPGYINNNLNMYNQLGENEVYGWNDFNLGATYMFLSERFGDPVSMAFSLGLNLPTGQSGDSHPPGFGAWGWNTKIGLTKIFQPKHRIDWDLGFAQPFEEGNQDVERGYTVNSNISYHYVINDNFDIGLEAMYSTTDAGERNGKDMNNGTSELYAGPAMNFVLPKLNMWMGIGAYFPVYRDADSPTAFEDYRIDFKLGKMWSF
ncbi:MAG: transporter [Desulfobulbaceae bacterium]|nr:transporter [Desulfobulbaceae bacterium]